MKHGLILITLSMFLAACSSEDVSQRKVIDTTNEISPQTIILEQSETITDSEIIESNENINLINSENDSNVETQSPLFISAQTSEEKEDSMEPEETLVEDYMIIGDTKYINLMQEEKFQDWINVAQKYGAALYAIPYSDVFAIVKEGEVVVGMSTGVASAAPNHIDILCDLMVDKGDYAVEIIEGIKQVAETGESIQLTGPQEFGDVFTIEKQDEWIVVSW